MSLCRYDDEVTARSTLNSMPVKAGDDGGLLYRSTSSVFTFLPWGGSAGRQAVTKRNTEHEKPCSFPCKLFSLRFILCLTCYRTNHSAPLAAKNWDLVPPQYFRVLNNLSLDVTCHNSGTGGRLFLKATSTLVDAA